MRTCKDLLAILLACSTVLFTRAAEAGPSTCGITSTGVKLCVKFDNSGVTPEETIHFDFDLMTNPDLPSVDLTEGDISGTLIKWRIWCEDSAGVEHNMGAITGSGAEDYDVTVLDDQTPTAGPGAVNVGGINLDPSVDTNYSRIDLGHITGDLTGTTFLQARIVNPQGTDLPFGDIWDLTVDGSVTADITTEGLIFDLKILGNLSGNLTTDFIYDYVFVHGDVSGDVVVGAMLNGNILKVLGNVSGRITVDVFRGGALLAIDGTASGAILILQNLASQGATDAVVKIGTFTGSLKINGNLDGFVDINGASSGTIDVIGITTGMIDILSNSTGVITLAGATSGDIIIGGYLDALLQIKNVLTSTGSITVQGDTRSNISTSGDCAGDIILNGHLLGDVDITLDLTSDGSIVIDDSMKSRARILVGGLIHGLVSVGTETVALSQIRAVEGLALNACIIINADQGVYDANGRIHLGPPTIPDPLNDIIFDGGIKIFDSAPVISAGDLEGTITVTGCHATVSDLDICVDGIINGSIILHQFGCANQVTHSCVGNCP